MLTSLKYVPRAACGSEVQCRRPWVSPQHCKNKFLPIKKCIKHVLLLLKDARAQKRTAPSVGRGDIWWCCCVQSWDGTQGPAHARRELHHGLPSPGCGVFFLEAFLGLRRGTGAFHLGSCAHEGTWYTHVHTREHLQECTGMHVWLLPATVLLQSSSEMGQLRLPRIPLTLGMTPGSPHS